MIQVAFMRRERWADNGRGMVPNSVPIHEWLKGSGHVVAVPDPMENPDFSDLEAVGFISPQDTRNALVGFEDLTTLERQAQQLHLPLLAVHPRPQDLPLLRRLVDDDRLSRLFVMVWSQAEPCQAWLDANQALDLLTGERVAAPDPLLVTACKLMISEEYNGLGTSRGKDTVIQLLRAFHAEGYPLDRKLWLRHYLAAGGEFRHAETVSKFIREMNHGTKHRTKERFLPNIVKILRDDLERGDD